MGRTSQRTGSPARYEDGMAILLRRSPFSPCLPDWGGRSFYISKTGSGSLERSQPASTGNTTVGACPVFYLSLFTSPKHRVIPADPSFILLFASWYCFSFQTTHQCSTPSPSSDDDYERCLASPFVSAQGGIGWLYVRYRTGRYVKSDWICQSCAWILVLCRSFSLECCR